MKASFEKLSPKALPNDGGNGGFSRVFARFPAEASIPGFHGRGWHGQETGHSRLLSYCGLYCGNCSGYKRGMPLMGKCAGCLENGGPPNCGIRECCQAKGYRTCAECDTLDDCGLLNTFVHKVARIVFGSDKRGNLTRIKSLGVEAFVQDRIQSGKK